MQLRIPFFMMEPKHREELIFYDHALADCPGAVSARHQYRGVFGLRRVPEKTLFLLALLGGSAGAWLGMKCFHHKTRKWYFRFGIPAIFIAQAALLCALLVWSGARYCG